MSNTVSQRALLLCVKCSGYLCVGSSCNVLSTLFPRAPLPREKSPARAVSVRGPSGSRLRPTFGFHRLRLLPVLCLILELLLKGGKFRQYRQREKDEHSRLPGSFSAGPERRWVAFPGRQRRCGIYRLGMRSTCVQNESALGDDGDGAPRQQEERRQRGRHDDGSSEQRSSSPSSSTTTRPGLRRRASGPGGPVRAAPSLQAESPPPILRQPSHIEPAPPALFLQALLFQLGLPPSPLPLLFLRPQSLFVLF